MDSINSVESLLSELKNADSDDYVAIAKNIAIHLTDFQKYISWDPDVYTRNCIEHNDDFELILICWKPSDHTAIHNHNDQRCWVYQVAGEMIEERFVEDEDGSLVKEHEMALKSGKLTYMHDSMGYHSLSNNTSENAITLHLYIKPIGECKVFDEEKQKFQTVEVDYHTIDGKLNLVKA